jgi:hypothetical protein
MWYRILLLLFIVIGIWHGYTAESVVHAETKKVVAKSEIPAHGDTAFAVIENYTNYINKRQCSEIPQLWIKKEQQFYTYFLNDKENIEKREGIFNIKTAKIVAWKELPFDIGRKFLPPRNRWDYGNRGSYLKKEFEELKSFM